MARTSRRRSSPPSLNRRVGGGRFWLAVSSSCTHGQRASVSLFGQQLNRIFDGRLWCVPDLELLDALCQDGLGFEGLLELLLQPQGEGLLARRHPHACDIPERVGKRSVGWKAMRGMGRMFVPRPFLSASAVS